MSRELEIDSRAPAHLEREWSNWGKYPEIIKDGKPSPLWVSSHCELSVCLHDPPSRSLDKYTFVPLFLVPNPLSSTQEELNKCLLNKGRNEPELLLVTIHIISSFFLKRGKGLNFSGIGPFPFGLIIALDQNSVNQITGLKNVSLFLSLLCVSYCFQK